MNRHVRLLVLVVLAGLVLLSSPAVFSAQKTTGLQITPLRSRPVQKPGDTSSGQITITNNTTAQMEVRLSVERFKVTDEDYHYDFAPGEHTDWVRLADQSVALEQNASKKIAYSLAVPADAPPGGYYFALFASTENNANTASFREVKRVASLLYLEVSGLQQRKLNLLGVDAPWLLKSRTVTVDSRVANQGNSHFEANLKHVVKPLFGSQQTSVKKNLILPGTIRHISTPLKLPWVPGIYKLSVEFSPPQGGRTQYVNQLLVYFPVWTRLVVAILLLGMIGRAITRRLKRKSKKFKVANH